MAYDRRMGAVGCQDVAVGGSLVLSFDLLQVLRCTLTMFVARSRVIDQIKSPQYLCVSVRRIGWMSTAVVTAVGSEVAAVHLSRRYCSKNQIMKGVVVGTCIGTDGLARYRGQVSSD